MWVERKRKLTAFICFLLKLGNGALFHLSPLPPLPIELLIDSISLPKSCASVIPVEEVVAVELETISFPFPFKRELKLKPLPPSSCEIEDDVGVLTDNGRESEVGNVGFEVDLEVL